jgi:hypothetical protein
MNHTHGTPFHAALAYLARGWRPIPLHSVIEGTAYCSCGDISPHAVAKHPKFKGWQELVRVDNLQIQAWWQKYPGANVGLVTGRQSGVWVLDVDPKSGGDRSLAELIAAHGELPTTYTVRTGSGGLHYYFLLPDGVTITNSKGTLAAGLDVRGDGGQVVAPPSVSGIGPYFVLADVELAPAPEWLIEMVLASDRAHTATRISAPRDLGTWTPVEMGHYVDSIVNGEYVHALSAPVGERNNTLNSACFAVATLLPRGVVAQARVEEVFWRAGEELGLGPWETRAVVASAIRGGWSKPREPWPPLGNDRALLWAPPLPSGGAVPVQAVAPEAGRDAAASEGGGLPWGPPARLNDVSGASGPEPAPEVGLKPTDVVLPSAADDPFELAVAAELWRERLRRTARRRLDREELESAADAVSVEALAAECLSSEDLETIPDLEPLIKGWISKDTVGRVYGASGSFKTFLTLDMACSVATGHGWFGYEVTKGRVLYVVAEGSRGIRKRVRAWEVARNDGARIGDDDLRIFPRPIQVGGEEWKTFVCMCKTSGFSLIILDTQARCTVGMEENSATDMGRVYDMADRLSKETGACVMFVHHTGYEGGHARGSSSVYGALQTEISVTREDMTIKLKQEKQKDEAAEGDVTFKLVPEVDSLVLVNLDGSDDDGGTPGRIRRELDRTVTETMSVRELAARTLHTIAGGAKGGVTRPDILTAVNDICRRAHLRPFVRNPKDADARSTTTLYTTLTRMEADGLIEKPTAARYRLSEAGCTAFGLAWHEDDAEES